MTDTQALIGQIISAEQQRDAIHIAVAPIKAIVPVTPGQSVNARGVPDDTTNVGIVDPFLRVPVNPGEWFFLFLYPNTITGLRHQWTHPAWPEPEPSIAGLADDLGLSYAETMEALRDYAAEEERTKPGKYVDQYYVVRREINCGADMAVVWADFARITGIVVKDRTAFPFSCAC